MKYRQGIQPAINLGQQLSLNSMDHISLTNYELYNKKTQKEQVEEPAQSETDNETNAEPNKRKTQKKQEKDKTNIVNKVKNSFLVLPHLHIHRKIRLSSKGLLQRMGNLSPFNEEK